MEPLPAGGLPANQTIEGGGQLRITDDGFQTIENLIVALLDDTLEDGFTTPSLTVVNEPPVLTAGACLSGCVVNVDVKDFGTNVVGNALRVSAIFDASTAIDVGVQGIAADLVLDPEDQSCTIDWSFTNASVSFDIGVGVDSGTGELDINFLNVNTLTLGTTSASGCGPVGDVIDAFTDLFNSVATFLTGQLGAFFGPLLAVVVDTLVDQLLPDPLGVAATADIGSLLTAFSPSTDAKLETKVIPGGYARIERDGLSLGIITGFNADYDPLTRAGSAASEPVLCVPPIAAPDFAGAPWQLTTIARNYGSPFQLAGAGAFTGQPDPAGADVVFGASNTMLDLMGHHLVTSGSLCLAVSTEAIEQFNLGTIGLFVPSFTELGDEDGKNPLMLVTRPTRTIDFTVGEGTATSPALTVHLDDFEIDFYAFIFERWVRGFTISLNADIGIDLEFTTDTDGNPAVLPVLSGLDANDLQITVLNSDFVRETPAELESVFPTLLSLALPLITSSLGEISLPQVAGFTLDNLDLGKVTTSEDDFLAITGGLATTSAMQPMIDLMAEKYPTVAAQLEDLKVQPVAKVKTEARLGSVYVPSPATIRASLLSEDGSGGELPEIVLDVPSTDARGRALEYTFSLDGGMWRPFRRPANGRLLIQDRSLAVQGRRDVLVRARVVGNYRTLDTDSVRIPVVIDSAPPRVRADRMTQTGSRVHVPVYDLVTDAPRVAFSAPGADGPQTPWGDGTISTLEMSVLSGGTGSVVAWAEDDQGNRTQVPVPVPTAEVQPSGCNAAGGAGTTALYGLAGLLGILGLGGRRRRRLWNLAGVHRSIATGVALFAIAVSPGCSCGSDVQCSLDTDCAELCDPGTVPLCSEAGECLCADDIPFGRTGQFSSMAIASGELTWVSAYNSTHGDLMVAQWTGGGRIDESAWVFVDGVPEGPVALPESDVRGGIVEKGDDVGLYTDIAANNDVAYVAYFDKTHGSLKLAANYGGVWSTHVVDSGTPPNPEGGTYTTAGQYTSITLGPDGRPAIAYFYQQGISGDATTAVRWAQARNTQPASASDWDITTIDSAIVEGVSPGGLTIPEGLGLFVNSTRLVDGTPAVVYYDRQNGTLKVAVDGAEGWVPEVLDGGEGLDVGWYPSIAADSSGVLHVSYVDVINSDLLYINTSDLTPQLVDDGYRLVGTNADGLPKPEFHFVGDDSAIVLTAAGPIIAYQDATSHELLVARQEGDVWTWDPLAGDGASFAGGYGFYAEAEAGSDEVVISTWVVDQPNFDAWVEIFRVAFGVE